MKKVSLCILLLVIVSLLYGCIVTDNTDEYERKQFQSADTISEVVVTDLSTEINVRASDSNEVLVEYSDSPSDPWYSIAVLNGVLQIEKTRGTVGVEESSLTISLPQKEYQSISIKTTNGNIVFDNIASSIYQCSTQNGDIKGTLNGTATDYSIATTTQNGKSNLEKSETESSKSIQFDVINGSIDVKFDTREQI